MFWNNFVALCNEKNMTPNGVWKKGATPRDTTLQKVAAFFNVPAESLLAPTKSPFHFEDKLDLQLFAKEPKPSLDPQLLSLLEGMTTEELALLKQYAEFIKGRKKD